MVDAWKNSAHVPGLSSIFFGRIYIILHKIAQKLLLGKKTVLISFTVLLFNLYHLRLIAAVDFSCQKKTACK